MRERRFKKNRKPYKVFLVVCEGETEERYVEILRQLFRLPITIKTKVSGNVINDRLVNQYEKELGLNKEDECHIFYIYDGDIDCVADKILSLRGNAILSNPSIELWFLLHSRDFKRTISSEQLKKILINSNSIWKTYEKGSFSQEQKKHLIASYDEAKMRAKNLSWPENPSSNMYVFINALEYEKQ